MEFRTQYNYDADAVSQRTGLSCPPEEDMTQQQFAEEADINTIVRKFGITGKLPENFNMPVFVDVSDVPGDFHAAMLTVETQREAFMQIPAETRARFANDPQNLLNFLADDKNRDEAIKLGLIQPPREQTRDTVAPAATGGATGEPKP